MNEEKFISYSKKLKDFVLKVMFSVALKNTSSMILINTIIFALHCMYFVFLKLKFFISFSSGTCSDLHLSQDELSRVEQ